MNRTPQWFLRKVALAGVSAIPFVAVVADAEAENVSVRERPRPQYDALGIRAGSFLILPSATVTAEANDNIFASDGAEESDIVAGADAQFRLNSDWSNHSLGFVASSQNRFHQDFDAQDTTNTVLGASGRIDFRRDANLFADFAYTDGQEPLSQLPTVGLREPVDFQSTVGTVRAVMSGARTRVQARATVSAFDFEDGVLFDGSIQDQDDRDRTVVDGQVRGDLAISPDTAIFLAVGANQREYDQATSGGVRRDSDGYEVLFGANFDVSRLVRGDIGVGFLSQSFDQVGAEDVEEVAVRGQLEWFPSQLVTVTADASRGINDAALGGASSSVQSYGALRLDYELARSVIVSGGVNYTMDDYQGIDREDTRFGGGAEVQYLVNRAAAVFAKANTTSQSSDGVAPGREYDQNVFSIGFRLQR